MDDNGEYADRVQPGNASSWLAPATRPPLPARDVLSESSTSQEYGWCELQTPFAHIGLARRDAAQGTSRRPSARDTTPRSLTCAQDVKVEDCTRSRWCGSTFYDPMVISGCRPDVEQGGTAQPPRRRALWHISEDGRSHGSSRGIALRTTAGRPSGRSTTSTSRALVPATVREAPSAPTDGRSRCGDKPDRDWKSAHAIQSDWPDGSERDDLAYELPGELFEPYPRGGLLGLREAVEPVSCRRSATCRPDATLPASSWRIVPDPERPVGTSPPQR
jgi:hypothetical protein